MQNLDVILPAGGRVDDAFAAVAGTHIKALIEVGGASVLGRTIQALRGTGRVRRIVVTGPPEAQQAAQSLGADQTMPEGASGPENIYRGLECLTATGPEPERLLVVTTDLPFLSAEIVNRYLDLCPADKDFTVPLIAQREFQTRFPGSDATYVRLADGVWTTGCAYVIGVEALRRARPYIERVFENRKSKIGMARLLGPTFVFKWLTNRLRVPDIERKVSTLLGVQGAAVPHSPPELAFDIDYLEDYQYALAHGG